MTHGNWNREPEKKVDESWKDKVQSDRQKSVPPSPTGGVGKPTPKPAASAEKSTSRPLLNLISSLGYQAMMHLGEIPHPETNQPEISLENAREIIDLLAAVKEKTEGNLSPEEARMLTSLVSELQMKYAAHA